jgi:hypothetical protein
MAIMGPPIARTRGECWLWATESLFAGLDAAVVLTVSVAVTAVAPLIAGGAVTEQVAGYDSTRSSSQST